MKPAFDIIGKEKCVGCFGCVDGCPSKAIKMEYDDEGFYFPQVSSELCVNCGVCQKKCPVLSFELLPENWSNDKVIAYGGWSIHDDIRLASSSGGIFTEIARYLINKEWYVVGAAWDDDLQLRHQIVSRVEDLERLRGSKYIQSSLAGIFIKVKELLDEGKNVLFCGTPCQVAAINLFMGSRDNLITCDLICHGVGSTKVFDAYIKNIANKEFIKSVSFRDKKKGWTNYSVKIEFKNGKSYYSSHRENPFMLGYLKNIYLRKSCYSCLYSQLPRFSDITLGDYWRAPIDIFDEKGVSVVIVNNDKGKAIIDELVQLRTIWIKEVDLDHVRTVNPRVVSGLCNIPKDRQQFFHDLTHKSFDNVVKKYLKPPSLLKKVLLKVKRKIRFP